MLIGRGLSKVAGGDSGPWNYFDNTYWVNIVNFIWSANTWTIASYPPFGGATIGTIGIWDEGFRPANIEVDYTTVSGALTFRLLDTNAVIIATQTGVTAGTALTLTLPINYASGDINQLQFSNPTPAAQGGITILDIRFTS